MNGEPPTSRAERHSLRRFAVFGSIVAMVALTASACFRDDVSETRFPNPDGSLTAIVRVTSGGGAAGWMTFDLMLENEQHEQITFAELRHADPLVLTWRTPDELDVCTSADIESWAAAASVPTSKGLRTVQISWSGSAHFENISDVKILHVDGSCPSTQRAIQK